MKMKAREERRKEREIRRMEKNKKKSSPNNVADLGPLGNILRAIIQANTWTWNNVEFLQSSLQSGHYNSLLLQSSSYNIKIYTYIDNEWEIIFREN